MKKLFTEIFTPAVLLSISFCLVGCGDMSGSNDGPGTTTVATWSADAVRVRCPSRDCPEGVGALVFVQNINSGFRLQRCTGTLIASDRVLTNSHCGKSIVYDRAYFFVPHGGRTVRVNLGPRVYDREDGYGLEAGMGADLAIFQLADALPELQPRRISRHLPDDMSQLVVYKIDEPGGSTFERLSLQRDVCTTVPRQAIFGGGTDDDNIGLALFGCEIVHGNSGSPAFCKGNLQDVQVIVNTSYPFHQLSTSSRLDALFSSRPSFFSENFAMGNRIQCMEIPGQTQPQAHCTRATVDDQIRRPFETSSLRIERERLAQLNTDPLAVWGLKVFKVRVKSRLDDQYAKSGMVLVPVPQCVSTSAAHGELSTQQAQFLTLDMDSAGSVTGVVQKTQVVKAHFAKIFAADKFAVSFDRDYRTGSNFDSLNFEDLRVESQVLNATGMEIERCGAANMQASIQDDQPTVIPQFVIK
jgi:hypothetical protein